MISTHHSRFDFCVHTAAAMAATLLGVGAFLPPAVLAQSCATPPAAPDATTTVIATAELRVSITYSTPYLMVGDQWSYTITVTNSGSVSASGIFLTNTFHSLDHRRDEGASHSADWRHAILSVEKTLKVTCQKVAAHEGEIGSALSQGHVSRGKLRAFFSVPTRLSFRHDANH